MREIKFRGLDTVYNSMTMDLQRDYIVGEWVDDPRFIVMQYTGLKDKNGKEIYEGDIVKYTSMERTGTRASYRRRSVESYAINSNVEITAVVELGVHLNISTYVAATEQVTKYESYFSCESRRDTPKLQVNNLTKPLFTHVQYEVIGNIYEHPHLLEVSK